MNYRKICLRMAVSAILIFGLLGCTQPEQQSNQAGKAENEMPTAIVNAVKYVNSRLLQPGYNATLINYTTYGSSLYKLTLNFTRNGWPAGQQDIFLTLDGDVLVLSKNCILDINKTLAKDPVENALRFINGLLRPGTSVKILNTSSFGDNLLKIQLEFVQNGSTVGVESVYLTKDGKELIAGGNCVVDIYNKYNRVNIPIDEDDMYLGNRSAKVTIVEFSDFACPYCAMFENNVLQKILDKYGDKILFVYKDFPLHGKTSILATSAARCAGEQGRYWEYHRILFQRQAQWTKNITMLKTYARELELDIQKFEECLDSGKYEKAINEDRRQGMIAGVSGTPTIFINGVKYVGVQSFERLSQIIDGELLGE